MTSFLKSIFHSSNKHKKLSEEWTNNREPVVEGITFYVRYLGSSLVEDPKSAQSTAAGVKRVIQAAKVKARRPEKVSLRVAIEGVRIDNTTTGETIMDTSIYKISYCSADSQYEQVLAFVASNEDESCECHAFLCSKRKVAEAIAVSIAQAFTMAFECWQLAVEAKQNGRNVLTAEQMAGRGVESPSRLSKGREGCNSSRASSPEHSPGHSSPPSEVSSTSGYQSSTLGGLLLELDYTDAGSDGALAPQLQDPPTGQSRSRKHWTSFDDVSDLADDFVRLSSGPVMSSCPWVHRTNPPTTDTGSCRSEWPGGSRTPLSPPAAAGTMEGVTTKVLLPPCAPAAIAPSTATTAAVATPSLTQSRNSCWLPATKELHKRALQTPQPAGGNVDGSVLPPTAQTDPVAFLGFTTKRPTCSDMLTNPINHPDAKITNPTNTTDFASRPEYIVNRLSEDSSILHTSTCIGKQTHLGPAISLSSGVGAERGRSMKGGDVDAWQSGAAMAFCLIDGGISVPRDRWESFDSSPSPTSPALTSTSVPTPVSPTPSVAFGSFTIAIPTTSSSASIASTSSKISSSFSPRRPLSPNTAFLDSCLTPRPDDDDSKGPRFAFIGRLSGEGRIFTNTPIATPINGLCSQTTDSQKSNFRSNSNGSSLSNGSIRADLAGRNLQKFSRNSDAFSPQSPPPEAVR